MTPLRAMPLTLALLVATAAVALSAERAAACACCPERDEYDLETRAVTADTLAVLGPLRLGRSATRYFGGGEDDGAEALRHPAQAYPVTGVLTGKPWRFTFRTAGGPVTLSLTPPATFTRYAADIHDGRTFSGGGPLLLKEWRFEGALKDGGLFKAGQAPTRYVLVLQGRGGRCDEPGQFTRWHLGLQGGATAHAFDGTLGR